MMCNDSPETMRFAEAVVKGQDDDDEMDSLIEKTDLIGTWFLEGHPMHMMQLAAQHNRVNVLRNLLERRKDEIDVNVAHGFPQSMRTPLHYACMTRSIDVVEFLVKVPGINLNALDDFGNTPLDHFFTTFEEDSEHDETRGVMALLRAGATLPTNYDTQIVPRLKLFGRKKKLLKVVDRVRLATTLMMRGGVQTKNGTSLPDDLIRKTVTLL